MNVGRWNSAAIGCGVIFRLQVTYSGSESSRRWEKNKVSGEKTLDVVTRAILLRREPRTTALQTRGLSRNDVQECFRWLADLIYSSKSRGGGNEARG